MKLYSPSLECNSFVRDPVLEAEIQAESGTTQGLPGDICQRASSLDVEPPSPISERQPLESLSSIATYEADDKSCETFENIVNVAEILRGVEPVSDIISQVPPAISRQTESVALDPSNVSQEIKQSTETIPREPTKVVPASLPPSADAAQIVSEATTEYPVPIQVAESVLQPEPKESVSEDPRPIVEAVMSSIIAPVQEAAAAISEALLESDPNTPMGSIPTQPQQLNGDEPLLQMETNEVSALLLQDLNVEPLIDKISLATQLESKPLAQESEASQIQAEAEAISSPSAHIEETEMSASQQTKLMVDLSQATTAETQSSPVVQQQQQPIASEPSEKLSSVAAKLASEESPAKPKLENFPIPGTPVVIEATPPTSPPLETEAIQVAKKEIVKQVQPKTEVPAAEVQTKPPTEVASAAPAKSQAEVPIEAQTEQPPESEQTAKKVRKVVKKSSVDSDVPSSPESEGSSKKITKKVVKSTTKKSKDGEDEAESGKSSDKPKKVVKTAKKVSKTSPSASLDTDKAVPETPPPSGSAEVPVPPKRKAKSSSSTKSKKPDES